MLFTEPRDVSWIDSGVSRIISWTNLENKLSPCKQFEGDIKLKALLVLPLLLKLSLFSC